MAKRMVLVDGVYVPLSEYQGRRKPDVEKPQVISVSDDKAGMESQHLHEMTFQEMRRFCSSIGIKYNRKDNRKSLMGKIKHYYEEKA